MLIKKKIPLTRGEARIPVLWVLDTEKKQLKRKRPSVCMWTTGSTKPYVWLLPNEYFPVVLVPLEAPRFWKTVFKIWGYFTWRLPTIFNIFSEKAPSIPLFFQKSQKWFFLLLSHVVNIYISGDLFTLLFLCVHVL